MKWGMGAGKGAGLKIATALKAGRIAANHNRTVLVGLKVQTAHKAGRLAGNHDRALR